jgi:hypothetical protein
MGNVIKGLVVALALAAAPVLVGGTAEAAVDTHLACGISGGPCEPGCDVNTDPNQCAGPQDPAPPVEKKKPKPKPSPAPKPGD